MRPAAGYEASCMVSTSGGMYDYTTTTVMAAPAAPNLVPALLSQLL